MTRLTLVVAATPTHGIGKSGGLPWRLPKEMSYFARITSSAPDGKRNAVIMGRNTWESIPTKFRPLPERLNVVLTRSVGYQLMKDQTTENDEAVVQPDLHSAITYLSTRPTPVDRCFMIGGASLYSESLALPATSDFFVDRVLLTRVLELAFDECDTFVPELAQMTGEAAEESWMRAPHSDLCSWARFDVPEGCQEEKGIRYEFQMWVRRHL